MNILNKLFWYLLFITLTCDLWQSLEMLFYNTIQPRKVDDIITIVFSMGMVIAYYMGKYDKDETE